MQQKVPASWFSPCSKTTTPCRGDTGPVPANAGRRRIYVFRPWVCAASASHPADIELGTTASADVGSIKLAPIQKEDHHARPPHRRAPLHQEARPDRQGRDRHLRRHRRRVGELPLGAHFLDKSKNDDFVDLHTDRTFTNEIKVRLKKRDGGLGGTNDKDLGLKVYDKTELTNDGEAVFGTDGISYTMDYRITA
ncbi:MAG TPA: hypothetical protein VIT65_02440 [Microlunatus sp.]